MNALAGLWLLAKLFLGRVGKALAAIPFTAWAAIGAVVIIAVLLRSLGNAHQREANLTAWQDSVIDATSVAFGKPDAKGLYPLFKPEAVEPAIYAGGQALRDLKAATVTANAGIAHTAADGVARRETGHQAAVTYDAGQRAVDDALAALRKTPAPTSAQTDAVEAIELGRASWKDLR